MIFVGDFTLLILSIDSCDKENNLFPVKSISAMSCFSTITFIATTTAIIMIINNNVSVVLASQLAFFVLYLFCFHLLFFLSQQIPPYFTNFLLLITTIVNATNMAVIEIKLIVSVIGNTPVAKG